MKATRPASGVQAISPACSDGPLSISAIFAFFMSFPTHSDWHRPAAQRASKT